MSKEIEISKLIEIITKKYFKFVEKYDRDFILAICGREGSGKSTLALLIFANVLIKLQEKGEVRIPENDEEFKKFIDGLIYYKISEEDMTNFMISAVERYTINKRYGLPFIFDEAGAMFYLRESMRKHNIVFNKFLIKCRKMHHFIILCSPSFFNLDKYIRTFRVMEAVFIHDIYSVSEEDIEISDRLYSYFSVTKMRRLLSTFQERKLKELLDYGRIRRIKIYTEVIGQKILRKPIVEEKYIETYASFYCYYNKNPIEVIKEKNKNLFNFASRILSIYDNIKDKELIETLNILKEFVKGNPELLERIEMILNRKENKKEKKFKFLHDP